MSARPCPRLAVGGQAALPLALGSLYHPGTHLCARCGVGVQDTSAATPALQCDQVGPGTAVSITLPAHPVSSPQLTPGDAGWARRLAAQPPGETAAAPKLPQPGTASSQVELRVGRTCRHPPQALGSSASPLGYETEPHCKGRACGSEPWAPRRTAPCVGDSRSGLWPRPYPAHFPGCGGGTRARGPNQDSSLKPHSRQTSLKQAGPPGQGCSVAREDTKTENQAGR